MKQLIHLSSLNFRRLLDICTFPLLYLILSTAVLCGVLLQIVIWDYFIVHSALEFKKNYQLDLDIGHRRDVVALCILFILIDIDYPLLNFLPSFD